MHQRAFKGKLEGPIRIGEARDISPRIKGLNLSREKGLISALLGRMIPGPSPKKFAKQGRALMPVIHGSKGTMRSRKDGTNFKAKEIIKTLNKKPRSVKL